MNKWTITWPVHTHPIQPTVIHAKYIAYMDEAVVLHDGSSDRPVAVISYENFRLIRREELR